MIYFPVRPGRSVAEFKDSNIFKKFKKMNAKFEFESFNSGLKAFAQDERILDSTC